MQRKLETNVQLLKLDKKLFKKLMIGINFVTKISKFLKRYNQILKKVLSLIVF